MSSHPHPAQLTAPGAGARPVVQRAAGTLPLPPAITPRGPVTWVRPPAEGHPLQLCREIDFFSALHSLGKVGSGP